MKIELIAHTPDPDAVIERACRICYASEGNENNRKAFIQSIIKRGHESVLEHASATFKISEVSRALSHQLVRHRIASYSQRSQRYVKETGFEHVLPPSIEYTYLARKKYQTVMEFLSTAYSDLLALGIPAEDARMVLPNACCTEVITTMNFRALRHFFKLRCDKHAQWEIREMAQSMLSLAAEISDAVFGDLGYTNPLTSQ